MRAIAVPGINIQIPVVGFGCSRLASVGEKKALQLLGTAFDAGVRHFDVARYYGYGEAEGLLGTFVKSRRAEVTITTKFGIEPPRRTSVLGFAMQAGRRLVQFVPAARGFLRRRAQGLVKSGAFSVRDAQTSLETSLRELGTDYIDFFLLHEYTVSENSPDELVAFLTDTVKAGKIRYFGLATGIETVMQAMEHQPELCTIVQFENSVLHRNVERLPRGGSHRLTITFGSLSPGFQSVSGFLKAHGEIAGNWSAELAVDCSKDETISALMLNYSVQADPNGLVLFSSKNASRVHRNVRAVLEPDLSPAQVELFGQLVERDMMPTA
ncbi:MAG TPA: aldo/keto reductase [Verrucomicrobiae bacterium]|nr:aldo/keto reductase [Verrucomicrobiae bacterium]